jgi:hypothetical protein
VRRQGHSVAANLSSGEIRWRLTLVEVEGPAMGMHGAPEQTKPWFAASRRAQRITAGGIEAFKSGRHHRNSHGRRRPR